jgi:hypothetical protein
MVKKISVFRENDAKYFKDYLADVIREVILDESQNTLAADINEIMLGYYALGESWGTFVGAEEAQAALEKRKEQLGQEVFDMQAGRAKIMAQETIAWANANGFDGNPARAWWTARPGVLSKAVGQEVDSRKNPTDTLLQFGDESFLGVSAKSTKGKGDIGFKNPGIGSLSKALGIDLASFIIKTEQDAVEEFKLPQSKKQRKPFIRQNPEIREKTVQIGIKILATLRAALFDHLTGLDQDDLRAHVVGVWMDAGESYPYYIKVTGHGKREPFSASVMDPTNNPKMKALAADEVKLVKVGNESIGVAAGDKKIMKMRFKYESEKLASSIKLSGDPW